MQSINPRRGSDIAVAAPWYRTLDGGQWKALLASNLGWAFDGYELYALVLTVGVALRQLLDPSQYKVLPAYAGTVIAINVLGWGIGGLIGGVVADYLGRKRTMILAILAYSLTTGLSALAWNWVSFAVLRLVVGIAIGSEWVTGASIMAELWPDHARGKGAGLMQCGAGIGNFLASAVWLGLAGTGPNSWRWMYLVGILPALFTLWIRRGIPESPRWERADTRRRAARERQRRGAALDREEAAFARFTVVDLFAERAVRWRLVLSLLMTLSTAVAWWGVASWIPPYVGALAAGSGLSAPHWAALAGMIYNIVGIAGYVALGFLADAVGRRPVTMLWFLAGVVLTPVLFLWTHDIRLILLAVGLNGFFTLGIWACLPIWLPELYPTRMRATAVAFSFNAPRLIAFVGPLIAGTLIVALGGYGRAATIVGMFYLLGFVAAPFLPETRGKPLPESV
ncbi:MAG TPA: MFS transporter [Stellaceae bacterium]|nr:MFS transporter [Stellaceae bacterium]